MSCEREDLTGQHFGKLLVLSPSRRNTSRTDRMWTCRCDCGIEKRIRETRLKNGKARDCGCSKPRRTVKPNDKTVREWVIYKYQYNAREAKKDFALSYEDCCKLFAGTCFYCGKPPSNVAERPQGILVYSGIDRLNSDIGFVTGNVVSCCKTCNLAKRTQKVGEFLEWIRTVVRHMKIVD